MFFQWLEESDAWAPRGMRAFKCGELASEAAEAAMRRCDRFQFLDNHWAIRVVRRDLQGKFRTDGLVAQQERF